MNKFQYTRVPRTPFIPMHFPDGQYLTLREAANILQCSCPKPLLIFLTHRNIDTIPISPLQYNLDFKIIKIPKSHLPDGPAFSDFKATVYNYLRINQTGQIGVCTAKRNDLCGYFIVRWLIEEKQVPVDEAYNLYKQIVPSGVTKSKYVSSIKEIYEFDMSTDAAIMNAVNSVNIIQSAVFDSSIASLPDSPSASNAQEDDSLIRVKVIEENITRVNRNYVFNQCNDAVLEAVGVNLQPKEAQSISSELRILLSLRDKDYFINPYLKFSSTTARRIKEDVNSPYMVMLEPQGKRCLLYIRGPDRYLVGDGNFLRHVNLYLPENEKRDQSISSGVLEGTLARESEETFRTTFYVSDILSFDGDDLRGKPFEYRMGIVFSKIIKFRKEQQAHGLNPEKFTEDELSIDIRPYLRLRYIDSIFENPSKFLSVPVHGLAFTSKSAPPSSKYRFCYFWKSDTQEDITVKVKITENGSAEGVALTTTDGEFSVVCFKPVTPALTKLDGRLVDIEMDYQKNQWFTKGISEHRYPIYKERFFDLLDRPNGNRYGVDELKGDIQQIILMPAYIAEDRQKHHKK